jgi:hypothetical protein
MANCAHCSVSIAIDTVSHVAAVQATLDARGAAGPLSPNHRQLGFESPGAASSMSIEYPAVAATAAGLSTSPGALAVAAGNINSDVAASGAAIGRGDSQVLGMQTQHQVRSCTPAS